MDRDYFYENFYERASKSGATGMVNRVAHKSLEWKLPLDEVGVTDKILEVGAGQGQHSSFVSHDYSEYFETDIRIRDENEFDVQINLRERQSNSKVIKRLKVDASDLSKFSDGNFDRLIASCLLIHIHDQEKTLSEWKRVVRKGGLVSIYLPCEPGILLRLARKLTTARFAKKNGYSQKDIIFKDHITYHDRSLHLIKAEFSDSNITIRRFPFFIPSFNLNLWTVIQIVKGTKD
jgi:phosphatidylethanolamine/phosphatidyl-N-methylethanolamine N-methyltransferase